MIRIFCDWNAGIDEFRYDLGCPASMRDITAHAASLKDGERVMFYEPDELEAEGTIHFDQESMRWYGVPDFSTKRYIGRSAEFEKNA